MFVITKRIPPPTINFSDAARTNKFFVITSMYDILQNQTCLFVLQVWNPNLYGISQFYIISKDQYIYDNLICAIRFDTKYSNVYQKNFTFAI